MERRTRERDGTSTGQDAWQGALLQWYERHRRDLPWRADPTPYATWVSEIMLQQTRVETVVSYFRRFMHRFPTIHDLARASSDEVLALWSGLGYYRRARALHAGARAVIEEHGGSFPRDMQKALELPGIGPYTAGAILSIAYGLPVPVVDGNVERVLTRIYRLSGARASQRALRELAVGLIPTGRASSFNQSLMELGATICTPASPRCGSCPVRLRCGARADGTQEEYPERAPKRAAVSVRLDAAVVRRDGRFLLERRESGSYLLGLWLFPLEEAPEPRGRAGASRPSSPLQRALESRFRLDPSRAELLGEVRHSITFRRFRVRAFLLDAAGGEALRTPDPTRWMWAAPEDLGRTIAVPSLVPKILGLLSPGRS